MANWGFLTSHARVLMCIARDPGARLRDIAASLGITERSAYGIVTDLAGAGYVIKQSTIYSSNILLVFNCEYRLRAAPGTGRRSCRPERAMPSA